MVVGVAGGNSIFNRTEITFIGYDKLSLLAGYSGWVVCHKTGFHPSVYPGQLSLHSRTAVITCWTSAEEAVIVGSTTHPAKGDFHEHPAGPHYQIVFPPVGSKLRAGVLLYL
jgi:hypothetical protein